MTPAPFPAPPQGSFPGVQKNWWKDSPIPEKYFPAEPSDVQFPPHIPTSNIDTVYFYSPQSYKLSPDPELESDFSILPVPPDPKPAAPSCNPKIAPLFSEAPAHLLCRAESSFSHIHGKSSA